MNLKYILGAIVSIPLLPIIYFQGKKVRASIPKLAEAVGNEGEVGEGRLFKMLAIGESTIAGVGVKTHEEGFTGALAKELAAGLNMKVSWKVYARSGYTAARVRSKLLPKIMDQNINLIVVGLGGNDAFTLNRPWVWVRDIKAIIDDVQKKYPDTPIVFANMPPIKLFPAFTPAIQFVLGNLVEIHGRALEKLVKNMPNVYYNSDLITLEGWLRKWEIDPGTAQFFSDGVHPSKLTYQTWGKDMARFILDKKVLK
ncbi:MAG: SGNH/GDSL hydrolase family protein [Cyclobacteriaceae bacterium]